MSKILVDRALIEQAYCVVDAWHADCDMETYWFNMIAAMQTLNELLTKHIMQQPTVQHLPADDTEGGAL